MAQLTASSSAICPVSLSRSVHPGRLVPIARMTDMELEGLKHISEAAQAASWPADESRSTASM